MRTTIATGAAVAVLLGLTAIPAQAAEPTLVGVRWDLNGTRTMLAPLPGSTQSYPIALNDHNIAVGYASLLVGGEEVYHAVRWDAAGKVTDLGVLPGDALSYATAVNAGGVTVGLSRPADDAVTHALRWAADGTMTRLAGLPGATDTEPKAIAADGTVVGHSGTKAVKWRPDGTLVVLPGFADGYSEAEAITDSGWISGQSGAHTVRWRPDGTITDLGAPSEPNWISIVGIAEDGTVGGQATTSLAGGATAIWAQRWDAAGHVTRLRPPTGVAMAYATDMNNSHVVIGFVAGTTGWKPVRWSSDGRLERLRDLGGSTTADVINDAGVMAGTSNSHAVRWGPGGLTNLGVPAGFRSTQSIAINDGGSIVGLAY